MKLNLTEIIAAGAKVKELDELLQIENGDKRWQAVQKWLKENPGWEKRKNRFLNCTPDEGIVWLCEYLGFNSSLLPLFDRDGQVRAMIKNAIQRLQKLYEAREAMDQDTNGQKPKKKSHRRVKLPS